MFARMNLALCATTLLTVSIAADRFNVPGQHRTRTPAAMKGDRIPLRFSDGRPTGFYARGDDPSKQGGGRNPACPPGMLELDAQEIITTASGMKLLFHPGGGGSHYTDPVENGQYGHVALDDLKSPPKLKPVGLNGKAAPTSGIRYFVEPTRIPHDMWYKPNVSPKGTSGSTYYTYGNPGFDKTRGRGDWTYLNWSWVQNGNGAAFPKNKCGGGGMVRALVSRGEIFTASEVAPIIGFSYGANNKPNGRVTAIYGATHAGPGDKGTEMHGWLPHSYQKLGDIIVPCLRRDPETSAPKLAASQSRSPDREARMAENLLSETEPDAAARSQLLKRLSSETDAAARMETLTELSRMDDADTVAALLKFVANERDSHVREQAIVLLGYMRSTPGKAKAFCDFISAVYRRTDSHRERLRILDVLGSVATADSVRAVRDLHSAAAAAKSEDRFATDDALIRLASVGMEVDATLLAQSKAELSARPWETGSKSDSDDAE